MNSILSQLFHVYNQSQEAVAKNIGWESIHWERTMNSGIYPGTLLNIIFDDEESHSPDRRICPSKKSEELDYHHNICHHVNTNKGRPVSPLQYDFLWVEWNNAFDIRQGIVKRKHRDTGTKNRKQKLVLTVFWCPEEHITSSHSPQLLKWSDLVIESIKKITQTGPNKNVSKESWIGVESHFWVSTSIPFLQCVILHIITPTSGRKGCTNTKMRNNWCIFMIILQNMKQLYLKRTNRHSFSMAPISESARKWTSNEKFRHALKLYLKFIFGDSGTQRFYIGISRQSPSLHFIR